MVGSPRVLPTDIRMWPCGDTPLRTTRFRAKHSPRRCTIRVLRATEHHSTTPGDTTSITPTMATPMARVVVTSTSPTARPRSIVMVLSSTRPTSTVRGIRLRAIATLQRVATTALEQMVGCLRVCQWDSTTAEPMSTQPPTPDRSINRVRVADMARLMLCRHDVKKSNQGRWL